VERHRGYVSGRNSRAADNDAGTDWGPSVPCMVGDCAGDWRREVLFIGSSEHGMVEGCATAMHRAIHDLDTENHVPLFRILCLHHSRPLGITAVDFITIALSYSRFHAQIVTEVLD
jgi:uncharacterized membrane-anchored protein